MYILVWWVAHLGTQPPILASDCIGHVEGRNGRGGLGVAPCLALLGFGTLLCSVGVSPSLADVGSNVLLLLRNDPEDTGGGEIVSAVGDSSSGDFSWTDGASTSGTSGGSSLYVDRARK